MRVGRCILPYGGSGGDPDPATYCPTNGYIDPTLPNDDWLILPKVYPKLGLLYNFYAATDPRNLTSIGWHISTYNENVTLQTYLGYNTVAGGKMKETGLTYWQTPNNGADNSSAFNGRGGGKRSETGAFSELYQYGSFGTSTTDFAFFRLFTLYFGGMSFGSISLDKKSGLSYRPIKDSTTLTHGQTGTYIDPSGYVYRTICIGTQEWVADNIKTQHYRDGTVIPEVTDNTAWAALTTGALCAYNNDLSNV